jgi:SAM-dependent methyltransferase
MMDFHQIIFREMDPSRMVKHGKIPWDDPDFSRRMLKEHLSQKYDSASRRTKLIKKHVDWIHHIVLAQRPCRILDLGCGPGFYTSRLAKLGHSCEGIDFSPESIKFAIENAVQNKIDCNYHLEDIRSANYGKQYDLIMLVFSEFNTFETKDAREILAKAYQSLNIGGTLLLEVPNFDAVEQLGNQPSVWYSEKNGIFSDHPYICLTESFWNEDEAIAIERYYIIDEKEANLHLYVNCTQAYDDDQFRQLLIEAGFHQIGFHQSLTGDKGQQLDGMFVILARK